VFRMTGRAVALAALCAGALAALLSYHFLSREGLQAAEMTTPVPVVVATEELPARTVIEPSMISEKTMPVATLPGNCANSVREVVGRVTLTALAVDEPIQRTAISAQTAALGLAYVVPDGMRAVTVALDSIIGVAGFLKPGDHVDVVATFDLDGLNGAAVTKTVLQDIELLAIGAEVLPEEVGKPLGERAARPREQPNATLAVTPEDAEKLILAESKGRLRLALRRAGDGAKLWLSGVSSGTLAGTRMVTAKKVATAPRSDAARRVSSAPAASPAPVAQSKADSVETIRGTAKSTVAVSPE